MVLKVVPYEIDGALGSPVLRTVSSENATTLMALQINQGRSKWWYGRIVVNGRKFNRNLGVEVRGIPPPNLSQQGDPVFERSRAKAQAALEKLQLDLKRRSTTEELVQTIHEIRTGGRVNAITLDEIGTRWKALPRRRTLNARYVSQAESWITKFTAFVTKSNPGVREMAHVQSAMARAFLKAEEDRGVSAKTYNSTLIFLRSVFQALRRDAGLAENPFEGIPTRDGETVFRKPFTEEELKLIVKAAKADPFIYPMIITGMCTAMRRGDCCTLLRDSVDLASGFVTVKTSKTSEVIQIPIFPLFREVLAESLARPAPKDTHYVFPHLEAQYRSNPDHLTDRVRRVMLEAGFFDPEDGKAGAIDGRGAVHAQRKEGLRRASIRDFHSFRVTWVTLALNAGVPLEIVQKVTGHRTAAIVLKHYFQPGRDDFRQSLAGKLPALLGGPLAAKPITPVEIRKLLVTMTPRSWRTIRNELVGRLPDESNKIVNVNATATNGT